MPLLLLLGVLILLLFAPHPPSKTQIALGDLATLRSALVRFHLDCGRYPTSAEAISALTARPASLRDRWNGPYLTSTPQDPWGHGYRYEPVGRDRFRVISLGADGKPGGTGADVDLTLFR